ncbi:proline-rich protein 18 [Aotus nancymaae]|uniref:proline-rich protein 18 n=1 Tax=Aotus nancymaae TaxID=37293 RepID=UPI0030FE3472
MPFPRVPPPPALAPAPAPGAQAALQLPRRPCAAGDKKKRPPERPEGLLSSSWPSATLKRPPARRGPGWNRMQPPAPPGFSPQTSPGRARAPATCATPRTTGSGHSPARTRTTYAATSAGTGTTAAGPSSGPGVGPGAAARFSLSLTPEAVLVIQRRHLEKQLLARPRRPFPSPSTEPRRLLAPCPRAREADSRRSGAASDPDTPPASLGRRAPRPRAPLLTGGLQVPQLSPRPGSLRPMLKVSLLNERHRYDDVEYEEEEAEALDEGLVRKCTEWLRGVESAAASRDRAGALVAQPHLSTL